MRTRKFLPYMELEFCVWGNCVADVTFIRSFLKNVIVMPENGFNFNFTNGRDIEASGIYRNKFQLKCLLLCQRCLSHSFNVIVKQICAEKVISQVNGFFPFLKNKVTHLTLFKCQIINITIFRVVFSPLKLSIIFYQFENCSITRKDDTFMVF